MISSRIYEKFYLFAIAALLLGGTALAQSHGSSATTSASTQQPGVQTPDGNAPNPQSMNDRDFVKKALEGGDAEVQLGQLAQQKSQSDDVKQFAQKMVLDHTQMGDQLMKPLAKQLGADQPKGLSKKDKQLMAKLESLSGPQFDDEYIKAMVKDHRQDLKDFKSEGQMTQNPNVKQAVQQGETVISQHLQMIEQIAQSHNITASNSKE
jgi:putative membrane protein